MYIDKVMKKKTHKFLCYFKQIYLTHIQQNYLTVFYSKTCTGRLLRFTTTTK